MRIILINSPLQNYGKVKKNEYYTTPPLGLGYLATIAKNLNCNVRLIDAEAQAQLSRLETAIKMYEMDIGNYPGENNKTLVAALTVNTEESGWSGPYLQIKKNELNGNGEYLDAWGNAFVYVNPGVHNESSYDLYSKGPDGVEDGNCKDDIKNWGEKNSSDAAQNPAE